MIRDLVSGKEQAALSGCPLHLTDLEFSPDGARIVTGGRDGTVQLWTVEKLLGARRP